MKKTDGIESYDVDTIRRFISNSTVFNWYSMVPNVAWWEILELVCHLLDLVTKVWFLEKKLKLIFCEIFPSVKILLLIPKINGFWLKECPRELLVSCQIGILFILSQNFWIASQVDQHWLRQTYGKQQCSLRSKKSSKQIHWQIKLKVYFLEKIKT